MRTVRGQTVVVTGGAGFIGSHLVERLAAERPDRIVVVDDLSLGKESNLSGARDLAPLTFVRADASDIEVMREIIRTHGADVIFSLAVLPLPHSLVSPRRNVELNIAIALTACELLREGLFRSLVHFSSSEVYGSAITATMSEEHPLQPRTPYAAAKAGGDHVALSYHRTFGLDVTVVRPFNNYGPRQNDADYAGVIPIMISRLLRGLPVEIDGDGSQSRDFIFVRDTAEAAVRIFAEERARGAVVNVASGTEIRIDQLAALIAEIVGVSARIVYGPQRPGDVHRHRADISLARRLIDLRPAVALREGLEETVSWYRQSLGTGNSR